MRDEERLFELLVKASDLVNTHNIPCFIHTDSGIISGEEFLDVSTSLKACIIEGTNEAGARTKGVYWISETENILIEEDKITILMKTKE
jgi:hypothetical protein